MDRIRQKRYTYRLLAVLLAFVVAVTFTPLFGDAAYAEDGQKGAANESTEVMLAGDGGVTGGQEIEVELAEEQGPDEDAVDITGGDETEASIEVIEADDEQASAQPDVSENDVSGEELEQYAEELESAAGSKAKAAEISDATNIYSMDVTRSGATVNVKASIKSPYRSDLYFIGLVVDGATVQSLNFLSDVNISLNMNDYAVGYHEIQLVTYSYSLGGTYYSAKSVQLTNISTAPNYNGIFEFYSTYLLYNPYDFGRNLAGYNLYMDYSSDGGKTWSTSGAMRSNSVQLYSSQQYRINGLKPNQTYRTRIYYGAQVSYNGKSLFIKGPVRDTGTYKTGKSTKPAIKSVTAKATNVKYHKVKHYGYYTGVYLYTEKFYTYKVKVTVTLKKKPGAAGLWINGKFVKGNKKKYTATFSPYPNYSAKKPKGKVKYKVAVCSYQSKAYGGFSPLYQKTKKLK